MLPVAPALLLVPLLQTALVLSSITVQLDYCCSLFVGLPAGVPGSVLPHASPDAFPSLAMSLAICWMFSTDFPHGGPHISVALRPCLTSPLEPLMHYLECSASIAPSALLSKLCSSTLLITQQLSRIAPSQWLAFALEWAIFGTRPFSRVCSDSFYAHLKLALFSRAVVRSTPE